MFEIHPADSTEILNPNSLNASKAASMSQTAIAVNSAKFKETVKRIENEIIAQTRAGYYKASCGAYDCSDEFREIMCKEFRSRGFEIEVDNYHSFFCIEWKKT